MAFSDIDIKKAIRKKEIVVEPLDEEQIKSASIDLTLSDEWYFFKRGFLRGNVDLKKTGFEETYEMKKSDTITLKYGEMCLGKTTERIKLAADIMGRLEGRSRYSIMGLVIHITSAIVQPGSNNRQVLEIVNLAPFTITLHKGMRISQVVFDRLESPTSKPYAKFGTIQ